MSFALDGSIMTYTFLFKAEFHFRKIVIEGEPRLGIKLSPYADEAYRHGDIEGKELDTFLDKANEYGNIIQDNVFLLEEEDSDFPDHENPFSTEDQEYDPSEPQYSAGFSFLEEDDDEDDEDYGLNLDSWKDG